MFISLSYASVFSRYFECLLYPNGMWRHFNRSTIYIASLPEGTPWRCRLGCEHDTLRLLLLRPHAGTQPIRPTCTPKHASCLIHWVDDINFRHRQQWPQVRRDVPLLHQIPRLQDRFGKSSDIWRNLDFWSTFRGRFVVLGNPRLFQESESIPKLVSLLSSSRACKEYVATVFYRSCKVLYLRESS